MLVLLSNFTALFVWVTFVFVRLLSLFYVYSYNDSFSISVFSLYVPLRFVFVVLIFRTVCPFWLLSILESQSLPFLQRSGSGDSEAGRTDEELSDVQVRLTNRGNATSSDHLLLRGEPNATPGAPGGNAGGGGGSTGGGPGGGRAASQRSSLNQPLPAPTVVATMSSSPSGVTTAVVNISPGGEAEQAHTTDDQVSVRISSLWTLL